MSLLHLWRAGVSVRTDETTAPDDQRAQARNGRLVERYRADLAAGIPDNPWPPVYPKMPDEAPRVAPSRARRPGPGG